MTSCLQCGATCADDAAFCAACGSPLKGAAAAAIERMIDARARAVVQEENDARARAEAASRRDAANEAEVARLSDRASAAREALAQNLAESASWLGSCLVSVKRVATIALIVGLFPGCGFVIHTALLPAFHVTPAGIVCPLVCSGCSASARTIGWNFKNLSWHSENGRMGYAFMCRNPTIDVEPLTRSDVDRDSALNRALQPYMLSSFVAWMLEVAITVPLIALALGPIYAVRRRRRVLAERPGLQAALADAEAALQAARGADAPREADPASR